MITGFNAIPYHCARLLHIGLNTEVKVTSYQIHFYGCQNNKRASEKTPSCHWGSNGCCILIVLQTTAYLYDLKLCDTHYHYVTDSVFRHSRLSDILSCDRPCRINGFWLYIHLILRSWWLHCLLDVLFGGRPLGRMFGIWPVIKLIYAR